MKKIMEIYLQKVTKGEKWCLLNGVHFKFRTSVSFTRWAPCKGFPAPDKPGALEQLKENMASETRKFNWKWEPFKRCYGARLKRARICEAKNGYHLKDVNFHTWVIFHLS